MANLENLKPSHGFSYIKRLTNLSHAYYVQEFFELMTSDVYPSKKASLKTYVNAEKANINQCRKNHYRVILKNKIAHLHSVMSALGIVLRRESKLKTVGGDIEWHNFEVKILATKNDTEYIAAVHSFLYTWSGTESTGADALVREARDIMKELENILSFTGAEQNLIDQIPNQESLRKPTDDYIKIIIKRAEVELYELNRDLESEEARWEEINQLCKSIISWINRIKLSVINRKKDEEDPEIEQKLVQSGEIIPEYKPLTEESGANHTGEDSVG